ncbi:MAG: hypothetical protein ACREKE_02795 [bacterium]
MSAYFRDLLEVGGRNPYAEPNFLLSLADETIPRTGGGVDRPIAPMFRHSWLLMEWRPREEFGSPEDWPGEQAGAYPLRGSYTILQPFPNQHPDSKFLNSTVVRRMAWISKRHRHDNFLKRMQIFSNQQASEDQERQERIEDMLQDAFPSFTGPTSFAMNSTTRTAVQNKLEKLEDMERRGLLNQNRPLGLQIRN